MFQIRGHALVVSVVGPVNERTCLLHGSYDCARPQHPHVDLEHMDTHRGYPWWKSTCCHSCFETDNDPPHIVARVYENVAKRCPRKRWHSWKLYHLWQFRPWRLFKSGSVFASKNPNERRHGERNKGTRWSRIKALLDRCEITLRRCLDVPAHLALCCAWECPYTSWTQAVTTHGYGAIYYILLSIMSMTLRKM